MLLLLWLLAGAAGQNPPSTPCPEVFQYWYQNGQWSGHVIVPLEDGVTDITVVTSLFVSDIIAPVPSGLYPTADINGVYRSVNAGWKNKPSIEYKLIFPIQSPIPLLDSITVNNISICQGIPAKVRYTTVSTCRALLSGKKKQQQAPLGHCDFHGTVWKSVGPSTPTAARLSLSSAKQSAADIADPPPQTTTIAKISCPDSPQNHQTRKNVTCGRPINPVRTIYNGMHTQRGDWPWIVALYYKAAMQLLCGGTLIGARHVITAAHCFKDTRRMTQIQEKDVLALLGKFDLSDWKESDDQCRQIEKIFIHPEYDARKIKNDIAILYLENRVKFNVFVIPICLYRPEMYTDAIATPTSGTVVGWGREERTMSVSERPLVAMIPIVSQETCINSDDEFKNYIDERTLCAGDKNGTGPCNGDSGGGLVVQIRDPDRKMRWYIRGIVSFSLKGDEDVCHLNDYSVYADVSQYIYWIDNVVLHGLNIDVPGNGRFPRK